MKLNCLIKNKKLLLLFAVLLSAVLIGCGEEVPSTVRKAAVPVQTVRVKYQEVTITSVLNGRVQPYLSAEVRPQITGIVKERRFEQGAEVKAGDILYILDDRRLQADYKNALALLRQRRAELKISQVRLERAQHLYAAQAISTQELEDAQLNYELAAANQTEAAAQVERCKVDISYTRISAPIDGIAGMTQVSVGALVTAEQSEPLTVIRQLDKVYVDIQQSARQWRRLRESILFGELTTDKNTSSVVLYNDSGEPYDSIGQLLLSELAVDENSGNITLRALFDNKHHLLVPGMAVQAKVIGGINPHSLVIPAPAVVRDPKGDTYAFVIVGDHRVQRRRLTLGILSPAGYEVLAGLNGDEEVVISGLTALRDGALVEIKNFAAEEPQAQKAQERTDTAESVDAAAGLEQ